MPLLAPDVRNPNPRKTVSPIRSSYDSAAFRIAWKFQCRCCLVLSLSPNSMLSQTRRGGFIVGGAAQGGELSDSRNSVPQDEVVSSEEIEETSPEECALPVVGREDLQEEVLVGAGNSLGASEERQETAAASCASEEAQEEEESSSAESSAETTMLEECPSNIETSIAIADTSRNIYKRQSNLGNNDNNDCSSHYD